jgi:hypothetical protein
MLRDERGGRWSEAITIGSRGDGICPALGERRVELFRAAVGRARSLRTVEQSQLYLLSAVAAVENPSDVQMFDVGHAPGEHGTCFPSVGECLIGT